MQKGLVCGLLLSSTMKPFILMLQVWCCISCYSLYSQRVCRGEGFDQYLVICQLKFSLHFWGDFHLHLGNVHFMGKWTCSQPCFAQFSWVPSCNSMRMLCVIFYIPFLMQRTQDSYSSHVSRNNDFRHFLNQPFIKRTFSEICFWICSRWKWGMVKESLILFSL